MGDSLCRPLQPASLNGRAWEEVQRSSTHTVPNLPTVVTMGGHGHGISEKEKKLSATKQKTSAQANACSRWMRQCIVHPPAHCKTRCDIPESWYAQSQGTFVIFVASGGSVPLSGTVCFLIHGSAYQQSPHTAGNRKVKT